MFPFSRLVDPERFSEASQEQMSQVRMGLTNTIGSLRRPLRNPPTQSKRQELLDRNYFPHNQKLTDAVEDSILADDHCLITDGHRFPALPLPYELQQTSCRPDFCLGTDDFHTSEELVARVEKISESCGYSTARNQPFTGTIVPMKHYRKDQRVQSLMIEVNRWLYLGEDYSVDSERVEALIEILIRVGEVLKEN